MEIWTQALSQGSKSCLYQVIYKRFHFLVALHFTSRRAITANWIWIKISCFFLWFQNLSISGLCVAIWNQFIEENQLRVESHWKKIWVISEGRGWSADASFRFVNEEDTNQDGGPQCLRMSLTPVQRNELVWRRNGVAEVGFRFLRVAWIRGGSTHAYNKCSWWVGMLK